MPTYEYRCNHCEHEFEVFQSIKAGPLKKCPECGKSVKRLISRGAGIIFKGTGFYQTDYRSQKYQDAAKNDKPAEKKKDSPKKKKDKS